MDAATVPGALVLVSNGVYQTGARAVYGMSNRVAVTTEVKRACARRIVVWTAPGPVSTRVNRGGVEGADLIEPLKMLQA